MGILLLACIASCGVSAWIMFALYGPPPAPRPLLVVARALPDVPLVPPAMADADAWIEGPTCAEAEVPVAPARPIAAPVLRRPRFERFELRTAPTRVFAYEERTQ
jgi:hypothetical protein